MEHLSKFLFCARKNGMWHVHVLGTNPARSLCGRGNETPDKPVLTVLPIESAEDDDLHRAQLNLKRHEVCSLCLTKFQEMHGYPLWEHSQKIALNRLTELCLTGCSLTMMATRSWPLRMVECSSTGGCGRCAGTSHAGPGSARRRDGHAPLTSTWAYVTPARTQAAVRCSRRWMTDTTLEGE